MSYPNVPGPPPLPPPAPRPQPNPPEPFLARGRSFRPPQKPPSVVAVAVVDLIAGLTIGSMAWGLYGYGHDSFVFDWILVGVGLVFTGGYLITEAPHALKTARAANAVAAVLPILEQMLRHLIYALRNMQEPWGAFEHVPICLFACLIVFPFCASQVHRRIRYDAQLAAAAAAIDQPVITARDDDFSDVPVGWDEAPKP